MQQALDDINIKNSYALTETFLALLQTYGLQRLFFHCASRRRIGYQVRLRSVFCSADSMIWAPRPVRTWDMLYPFTVLP